MRHKSIISAAKRLCRIGKYRAAVALLETNILPNRDDREFLLQLSLTYIYTQDYNGAQEILDKVAQTHRSEKSVLYINAVIALLQKDSKRALDIWVNMLKEDSNDAIARRGLKLLRAQSVVDTKTSRSIYNVVRTLIPKRLWHSAILQPVSVSIGIGSFLLLAGVVAVLFMLDDIPRIQNRSPLIIQDIPIQRTETIAISKQSRYQLDNEDINSTLAEIQQAFNAFNDAEACRLINYLRNSNITDELHNKLVNISQLLMKPTFISLTDSVAYEEVFSSPWLYDTCYVRWSGRAVEVQRQDNGLAQFLLYVGYEDTSILDGVVSSMLTIEYDISETEAIEVLGKLTASSTEIIGLEIVDVRPLYQ